MLLTGSIDNATSDTINTLLDNGVSVAIIGVVLFIGLSLAKMIPDLVKHRMEYDLKKQEAKDNLEMERNKRYDEQMEILVTVTQQGIEAQKRGNAVIEQNTEVIRKVRETEEKLNLTIVGFQKDLNQMRSEQLAEAEG